MSHSGPIRAKRTASVSDRDLANYYTQVAALLRAGINLHDAHVSIASRTRHRALREAATEIARRTAEGGPASAVMAEYVDVFPPHAVALVRAAERGGFLPEAYEMLREHASNRASINQWFYWVRWLGIQGLLTLAVCVSVMTAFWQSFHAGGRFFYFFSRSLLTQTLPYATLGILILVLIRVLLHSHATMRLRHRLILRAPYGFGRKARAEAVYYFLWTLQKLNQAGLPPQTAWAIAAGASPNAAYAERLYAVAAGPRENEPLSSFLQRTGLFDPDDEAMIRVAEQAGDVQGALQTMLESVAEEYQQGKTAARFGLASLGCLVFLITSGAAIIYFVSNYYARAFEEVDRWIQSP
jgi:type II secretory pathway component PulF